LHKFCLITIVHQFSKNNWWTFGRRLKDAIIPKLTCKGIYFFPQCFNFKNLAIFSQKKGEQKYSNLHLEKINPNLFVRKKRIAYMIDKGILSLSQLPYIKNPRLLLTCVVPVYSMYDI
jgi:hypothetical protein